MTSTMLDQERRRRLESLSRPAALQKEAPRRHVGLRPALGATAMAIAVGVTCYTLGQRTASSRGTEQAVTHAAAAPAIRAGELRPVPAALSLEASGFVTARRQSAVSAQITAQLAQLMVEEGQHVQQGQV